MIVQIVFRERYLFAFTCFSSRIRVLIAESYIHLTNTNIVAAADVNIYGYSSSSSSSSAISPLRGNHENTEVGKFLHDYLAVDVDAVTRKLRKAKDFKMSTKSSSSSSPSSSDDGSADQGGGNGDWMWMGNVPEEGKRLDGQDHLKEGNRKAGLGNGHRH